MGLAMGQVNRDHAAQARLIADSGLDWTIVRSAAQAFFCDRQHEAHAAQVFREFPHTLDLVFNTYFLVDYLFNCLFNHSATGRRSERAQPSYPSETTWSQCP